MSTVTQGDTLTVFKHESTGLAALCCEVAGLVHSGEAERRFRADLASARYERADGEHRVVFDVRPSPFEVVGAAEASVADDGSVRLAGLPACCAASGVGVCDSGPH